MEPLILYRDALLKAIDDLPADCMDGNLSPEDVRRIIQEEFEKLLESILEETCKQ